MSKIIAVFNQAGGVAKSTLTMNLGYQLAQRAAIPNSDFDNGIGEAGE